MKLTKHETRLVNNFIARGYSREVAIAAARMMTRGI